ncbi:hypothetical protein MHYP_G00090890 [Metynnis hypsauchen]
MLVPVECKEVRKWVRVSKKEDVFDYSEFITEILTKFGLPKETHVDLKDSSGIDVDSDIFDELVKSSQVSFVVSTEESSVLCMSSDERQSSSESSFCSEDSASSGSTLILESTKARRRQLIDGPVDPTTARDASLKVNITLWYSIGYVQRERLRLERFKCQLLNFILGETKLAVDTSRRNRVAQTSDDDAVRIFSRLRNDHIPVLLNQRPGEAARRVWVSASEKDCVGSRVLRRIGGVLRRSTTEIRRRLYPKNPVCSVTEQHNGRKSHEFRGRGVFTEVNMEKGSFILEYEGRQITGGDPDSFGERDFKQWGN